MYGFIDLTVIPAFAPFSRDSKYVEAADGAQAIEKYKACNGDIDVAILDIMMPYVDGLEVCKQLRAMNANLGIIMLTAKTQEMDKVSGLLIGADDYVTKPFSPSELMARDDDALSPRRDEHRVCGQLPRECYNLRRV